MYTGFVVQIPIFEPEAKRIELPRLRVPINLGRYPIVPPGSGASTTVATDGTSRYSRLIFHRMLASHESG